MDGVLKGTDTETADVFGIALPVRFSVGVRDDATPNGFFTGEIDEVRIYESALSQIQVQNVLNGLSCSNFAESLYYDFNDITLPTVEDEFGNQDGTISGATIVSSPIIINEDTSPDTDMDGVSNLCDLDDDNDGILNVDEYNLINVALSGTANQSSTAYGGAAGRAIDGNTNGNYNNDSVTHTDNNSDTEYWEVDLGNIINITNIIFYNRTNCCSDRISNVYVLVSDTPFPTDVSDLNGSLANADFTFQFATGESAASVAIPVNESGRYVRLQKSGDNIDKDLSIAELEVYTYGDTDNDGTPDYLDLDSDNDGCSDANEYYEDAYADGNADGSDDSQFGTTSSLTVDGDGLITTVGASYNGTPQALSNARDDSVADACTFIQNTSGDWNLPGNWNNNTVPQANQLAIIDDNVTSELNQAQAIKKLTLRSTSELNINANGVLQVGENLLNEGSMTFKSDAIGSGQFDEFTGTYSGTGTVEVERFIPAGDNLNNIPTNLGRAFRLLTSTVTTTSSIKDNWQEGVNNVDLNPANNQNPNPGYGIHITGSTTGANGFDATLVLETHLCLLLIMLQQELGAQDWIAQFLVLMVAIHLKPEELT